MLISNEGTKLGYTDSKVIVAILGNVDEIKVGLDGGTVMGSLDGSFDGSNDENIEGLLLGYSLKYTNGNMLSLYLEIYT